MCANNPKLLRRVFFFERCGAQKPASFARRAARARTDADDDDGSLETPDVRLRFVLVLCGTSDGEGSRGLLFIKSSFPRIQIILKCVERLPVCASVPVSRRSHRAECRAH